MGILKTSDFYYGAFLSALLNTAGKKPTLIDRDEKSDSRRVYRLTTDSGTEDCTIFAKYLSTPTSSTIDGNQRWCFQFTNAEISTFQELYASNSNLKFVFICGNSPFHKSEIALIDYSQTVECLGLSLRSHNINIIQMPNKHHLRIYGSGHDDKVKGSDNTIKISRRAIYQL